MGSAIDVEESIQIERTPADVWTAVADYQFDLEWRAGLREMTPDPAGPAAFGTRIHEVVRTSGRDYVADTVVTEFDPGVSYKFQGTGTIGDLTGSRAVQAGTSGAVFTYAVHLEPKGRMRLLRPLLGPLVRSGLKKDLRKLKTLLDRAA